MLSLNTQRQADAGQTTSLTRSNPITPNVGQGLAKNLRLFGWIEFWLQVVFAVFTALLLEFATSGRAFSPGAAGFGDAIYWGADGSYICCWLSSWPSITRAPRGTSLRGRILI